MNADRLQKKEVHMINYSGRVISFFCTKFVFCLASYHQSTKSGTESFFFLHMCTPTDRYNQTYKSKHNMQIMDKVVLVVSLAN